MALPNTGLWALGPVLTPRHRDLHAGIRTRADRSLLPLFYNRCQASSRRGCVPFQGARLLESEYTALLSIHLVVSPPGTRDAPPHNRNLRSRPHIEQRRAERGVYPEAWPVLLTGCGRCESAVSDRPPGSSAPSGDGVPCPVSRPRRRSSRASQASSAPSCTAQGRPILCQGGAGWARAR